jgi:hypothetical protein
VSNLDFYRLGQSHLAMKIINDNSKSACVIGGDALKQIEYQSKGKFNYTLLSQRLMTEFYGFSFQKYHFINEEFNRRTVQLLEAGVIDAIFKHYDNIYKIIGWKSEPEGPQVLTYDHLEFWFELLVILLMICLLSFIGEHLTQYVFNLDFSAYMIRMFRK